MPVWTPRPIVAFLNRFGEVVGGVVLLLLYFVLLGPLAFGIRLFADPLRLRRPRGSAFTRWERSNDTLAAARRQG